MVISLLLCGGGIAYAKVTGVCANCHTMHNSQDGAELSASPSDFLLKGGCVGCHTGTNTGANTTPYVMDTIAPTLTTMESSGTTLAGGNFWWVSQPLGDAKGHNVMGIAGQDSNITADAGAPGGTVFCGSSCHMTLAVTQIADPNLGSGCQGCHLNVMHHDDGPGTQYVGASPWYRFLSGHNLGLGKGVTGIEDNDWQFSIGAGNHNEYLGVVGPDKTGAGGFFNLGNTMTGFCTGCHGNFHIQDGTATGASPWLRHPSDSVIPNSGEYAAMSTVYNPDTPVARASLDTVNGTPSAIVTPGTDMVMCLSCHYAHGSPYDDILRWDYSDIIAGEGADDKGCFVCHTTKDDV